MSIDKDLFSEKKFDVIGIISGDILMCCRDRVKFGLQLKIHRQIGGQVLQSVSGQICNQLRKKLKYQTV